MNWWHWIVEAVTGHPRHVASPERGRRAENQDSSNATALLDSDGGSALPADREAEVSWWRPDGATRTSLAAPDCPALDAEGNALEHALSARLDGQDLSLPPVPRVVERVLTVLRDPQCDFDKLARIVEEDQVASAVVLRIANSPMYRGNDRITALRPALTRLGLDTIRTLMLHESLRAAMFPGGGSNRALAEMLWDRSLVGGCIMRRLSSLTGLDPESAFVVGLMHDVGHVVVLREAHRQHAVTHRHVQLETFEHLCSKFHQPLGRAVATLWQLPEEITALIADHHERPAANDPLRTHRWQLQLSDMIASMLGYGPDGAYDLMASEPVRALGLDGREDFPNLLDNLPEHIEETLSLSGR